MAAEAEVIVLCVTGSPEVEAAVAAIVPAARAGLTILDASTSDPEVTERLAKEAGIAGGYADRRAAVAEPGAGLDGGAHDLCRGAGGGGGEVAAASLDLGERGDRDRAGRWGRRMR